MKVMLIRYHDRGNINTRLPESLNKRQGVLPPLGIAYIAALLKENGYQVKILDAIALNLTRDEAAEEIKNFRPDIVGITAMTSSFKGSLEAAQLAHQNAAVVVLGGAHLAAYPKEALSYKCIDFGIIGEGEYPMLELVRALENAKPPFDIKGLVYKKGSEIFINEPFIVDDLDKLPFPARELLPNEKYSSIIGLHPVTTMITTRGCPYHCAFCAKQPSDKKYRARSAPNIVDEMESAVKKYGVKEIMFYDDTITADRGHIEPLCNEIIARGLQVVWETPARVNEIDEALLALMKKAGCLRIRYGVESGDPRILESMDKGITLPMVKKAFRLTKEARIQTFAYFMVGYLHDTLQSMENTLNFAKSLDPDLIMFTLTVPCPKTPLYESARKEGLIKGDYWREFTLGLREDRMPYLAPHADRWVKKCYRSFYLRPAYILKSISGIRSWDSIKKHFQALTGLLEWDN